MGLSMGNGISLVILLFESHIFSCHSSSQGSFYTRSVHGRIASSIVNFIHDVIKVAIVMQVVCRLLDFKLLLVTHYLAR